MALVRPSALVGAMSGSIGGVTFANARRGLVARQRQTRTPPNTTRSAQQQVLFANATRFWRTLDDVQRAAWRAAAPDFPQTNRIGLASPRSGYSLFLTVQINRARIGIAMSADVPKNILGTSLQTHVLTMTETDYSVVITPSGTPKTNTFVLIQGARHFSTIVPRFQAGFREITNQILLALSPTTIDFTTDWQAIFGAMEIGEAFAVRLVFYNHLTNMLHQNPIDATGLVLPDP